MSAPPAVRLAERSERALAADVLTDAFVDEAGLNWWLKQGDEKERARRKFFDAGARDVIHPKRDLWLAGAANGDAQGAAIWCGPGRTPFDHSAFRQLLLTPLWMAIAGRQGMQRAMALGAELAKHHPPVPHAHLVFLGVRTRAQGQGVGSAILKTTLAGVDALRVPAYLEATVPRNVELYQRHGFEVTAEFDVAGGGPHFWTMTRPAR